MSDLQLRLGGNGGRGPVEVIMFHDDDDDFDMTTLVTEYPGDDIQEIDLTRALEREGYRITDS